MTVRVILADDHQILRDGLRKLLEQQKGITVVGDAGDGVAAVEMTRLHKPDIVIMDIAMPKMNGLEATRMIKAEMPSTSIITLSVHADKQYVAKMIFAGASAYLRKDCVAEEIHRAIEVVLQDRIYLSPSVTGTTSGVTLRRSEISNHLMEALLSPKERQVLQLIADGNTNKSIAARLDMSERTVEKHRQHIMEKLGLYTVAELTKYAIREGITSLGQ